MKNNVAKIFAYSQGVEQRRSELYSIGEQLKKEFVGIDSVIDRIIKLMEPWRIMPDAQNRPVIINLWGMTGTGKTSLVRRISELLQSKLVQVDLGEFVEARNFSIDFYDKYYDLSEKECIILLDEIQNCRTVDHRTGSEIDRPALRGLWSLLSDGKIIPDKRISKEYYQEEIEEAIEKYVKNNGVIPEKKNKIKIDDNINIKDLAVYDPSNVIETGDSPSDEEDPKIPWKISSWTVNSVVKLCSPKLGYNKFQIADMLDQDFINTAYLLLRNLDGLDIQPQLNYKRSLIFIAGNLDEIYLMSKNANPDITPDFLHEKSKKITVPDVKNSLMKRFRPEQVARLGNSHVIYPAFSENNFRDIIKLDLKRIQKNTIEQYDVNMIFDQSVEDLIYKEGVFPSQGARPVLSTVSTLVEASIPSCLKEIITQYEKKPLRPYINIKMSLDYSDANAIFEMIDENNKLLNSEKIFLSIETLRQPVYDDEHILTAVHEAGHTICQLIEFSELPVKVCAFSPNVNSEGYMEGKSKEYTTKEMIYSYITVSLGGWAAEKIIFGDDKLGTGSSHDIAVASEWASSMIQSYGFGELPIVIQRCSDNSDRGIEYSTETESQIKKIVEECLHKSENNITKNKKILLEITGELLNNPHLTSSDISQILKRNNFNLFEKEKITKIFEEELSKNNIEWKAKYE